MTKRNSTTIALAYTTIWMIATRSASCMRKNTAIVSIVSSSHSAEWTGLREMMTPTAPIKAAAAQTKKITASIRRAAPWAFGPLRRAPRASSVCSSGGRTPKPSSPDQLTRPSYAALPDEEVARIHALGVVVLAAEPQLPRQPLRPAVVADEQLVLGVDRVGAVRERELEELRLGDRLGRARLDAQVAVDAAEVVDLVDEAVPLTRRDRIVDRVVGAADVDAPRRADARAQLAADALLHAVLVAVEDVTTVLPRRLLRLHGGIFRRETRLAHLPQRDPEPGKAAHQRNSSSCSPAFGIAR